MMDHKLGTKILCNMAIHACTDYLDISDKHKKDFGLFKVTASELNTIAWPLAAFELGGEKVWSKPRALGGQATGTGVDFATKRSGWFHGTEGGRRAYKYCEFFERVNKLTPDKYPITGLGGVSEDRLSKSRYYLVVLVINYLLNRRVGATRNSKIYRSSLASVLYIELLNTLISLYDNFIVFERDEAIARDDENSKLIGDLTQQNLIDHLSYFTSIGVRGSILGLVPNPIGEDKDDLRKAGLSAYLKHKAIDNVANVSKKARDYWNKVKPISNDKLEVANPRNNSFQRCSNTSLLKPREQSKKSIASHPSSRRCRNK